MNQNLSGLWNRVLAGDHDAWSELVAGHASLVYAVARRVGLEVPDAEDCAQWTWLSLYRQRQKIKDPQAIPAWLIRTTRRRAVRLARDRGQRSHAVPTDEPEAAAEIDPSELAEFRHDLPLALKHLDARCRKLLEHLFLDTPEKSYREAALLLQLDPDTIGPMRSRCLQRLRRILEKMGWDLH